MFAEKNPSQSGFPAGNWSGNTNDPTGRSLKCQVIEKRCTIFYKKSQENGLLPVRVWMQAEVYPLLGSHKRKDTFQETWAFWIALKSLAAWDDFTDSREKQERKALKAAISQEVQPVPITFLLPK